MSKKSDSALSEITIQKGEDPSSRQDEKEWSNIWAIKPPVDFALLTKVTEETFLVGGIIARIASTASSGWRLPEKIDEKLKKVLDSIDQRTLFTTLFTCGNAFMERIPYFTGGTTARLKSFLVTQVRVKVDTEKKELAYIQRPPFGGSEVTFKASEVIHFRLPSLSNRYYGTSPLARCASQISLLSRIDLYYDTMFHRWFLGVSVLNDIDGKLTEPDRKTLKAILEDQVKGQWNEFKTLVLWGKFEKLRLDESVDADAFLEYRRDLIKSIALSINIPYDLLISDSSNRATAQTSVETFNRDIIAPLQTLVMQTLQDALREQYPQIDEVSFIPVDVSNQKEEMEVWTGYRKGGVLTANEVREKLGYEKMDGGDELEMVSGKPESEIPATTEKIEKSLQRAYASLEAR